MNIEQLKRAVLEQLPVGNGNWHGITNENIRSFLVEPYALKVDPDDLETEPRDMWIALEERGRAGFMVAFDPMFGRWAVIESNGCGGHVQVVGGATLKLALEGM